MRKAAIVITAALLAGCATRTVAPPTSVVVAPPPPVVAVPDPSIVALVPPPRLPDGGYATPNHTLSTAGSVWHLRAALNVAVLACRDADEAALAASYNAALATHKAAFADAYRDLGREHGSVAAFDEAMTKLYNYFALPPAKAGLCNAARAVLADVATVPAGGLAAFAPGAIRRLDAPYVALFVAHDAWVAQRMATSAQTAAVTPAPRLTVDPTVLNRP